MIKESLIQMYENDLRKVIAEVKQYKSDEEFWKLAEGVSNSGGTLALHLIGNIKHYFGAVLGDSGYVRERDSEFADRNVARETIVAELENAIEVLKESLGGLSDEDFQKEYPEELAGSTQRTSAVAIYMLTHLNYHLGQINYHRRLLT